MRQTSKHSELATEPDSYLQRFRARAELCELQQSLPFEPRELGGDGHMRFDNPFRYCFVRTCDGRGMIVRFCWAVERNSFGDFLTWREDVTARTITRRYVRGCATRREAEESARRCCENFIHDRTNREAGARAD